MRIITEISLRDFHFWAGGAGTAEYLTYEELDTIEDILNKDNYLPTNTEINNFFWFEKDAIAQWLGYENFEEIMER